RAGTKIAKCIRNRPGPTRFARPELVHMVSCRFAFVTFSRQLIMPTDYLKRILTARVYDAAIETSLQHAPLISARIQNKVMLKREDEQPVFSFKLRGAYNRMANLPPAELKRGVIAASAGNHAQGVAYSARKLGCRAVIVMPTTTPSVKVNAV